MKKIILSLTFSVLCIFNANAQSKGDWYVGTSDITNKALSDWSFLPTIGYGVSDDVMVGVNISQVDSTVDISYDLHARYYFGNQLFAYAATNGFNTDNLKLGVGRMFGIAGGIYIDPKLMYDVKNKTTNLTLGLGLYF